MIRTDLHVHTTFCDGKNTPEEMVLSAIEKGMTCIGFSGHSFTPFDLEYCMSREDMRAYISEIDRLRGKYAGKIRILTGIEEDYFSDDDLSPFDYVIGSVHYLKCGDSYVPVDNSRETHLEAAEKYFGGDIYAFCAHYFETAADVVRKTDCDIIGHFDLISIFNDKDPYFDTEDPRYKAAWKSALDVLLRTGKPFEVNIGAITRGYRTLPYPSEEMREYILSHGGRLILSGDCHAADTLTKHFSDFEMLANTDAETVLSGTARNRH